MLRARVTPAILKEFLRNKNKSNFDLILYFQEGETKKEYRAWNPFRSKLAAAILGGVDKIYMPPGSKVLYLGAASGTTVSHVSDVVGPVCDTPNSKGVAFGPIRSSFYHTSYKFPAIWLVNWLCDNFECHTACVGY